MFCRNQLKFTTISAYFKVYNNHLYLQDDKLKFQVKSRFMSVPKKSKTSYPPLQLASFTSKGGTCKVGVQCSSTRWVVDVCAVDPTIPVDMRTFLEAGESAMEIANK